MSYIEEVLGRLDKRELLVWWYHSKAKKTEKNDFMLEGVPKMNDKSGHLESENVVVKQTNSLLSKRLVDMER